MTDLVLTSRYSDADGFGKACFYEAEGRSGLVLNNTAGRYQETASLPLRAALLRREFLTAERLKAALDTPAEAEIAGLSLLGTDEFNYCRNGRGAGAKLDTVRDLDLPFRGLSTADLYAAAESLAPAKTRIRPRAEKLPTLTAKTIFGGAVISRSMPLTKAMDGDTMVVTREEDTGKPAYMWMRRKFTRRSLGLTDQSMLRFDLDHDMHQAQLVVEFYTKDDVKISHSMLGHGGSHALAIPRECTQLRFGLRISGTGRMTLGDITFGEDSAVPPAIVGPAGTLVLTKQYPAYDDLYRYGFLHSRIRAYREADVGVDVFRLNATAPKTYTEFENIDVASGDIALLDATLATGKYKHVLVHMIDPTMWKALKPWLDTVKVTIWVHGAEIQDWKRRAYEFPTMSETEVAGKKKRTGAYMKLWREIFGSAHKNLHTVFVSETLYREGTEDVGAAPKKPHYSIIHNYVSPDLFDYAPKSAEQRTKILSVRPYSSITYANDLTVAAILELSKRPFFDELSFTLVGQGPLFDETTEPLRDFGNVTLDNRFVLQHEIAALHKRHGVLLVPTRMDSQGVSRDEAMSSGMVPVTSNVAAVPEFVDERCGFLAPAEDHLKLAEAIETLYRDPELFLKMSAAAAERVRRQSGFDQTIAREIALIEGKAPNT
ncbi:glycosyltransferase [Rhodobacteraceae bacterium CCMM004]|nr:glycosyltransferase [Rhodobacteraceae bacterium CCMM004]